MTDRTRLAAALCVGFFLCSCGGPGRDGQSMLGWLVIGHEVRSFRPCGTQQELWLMGNSPALEELKAGYAPAFLDAGPYASLFVSITGRRVAAPRDGFGANYEGGVIVDRLLQVGPQGGCGR